MNSATLTRGGLSASAWSGWLRPGRVFALVGGYFLLQMVLRTLISNSAELDESHQLILVQSRAWGYGSDPPLYTWLQILSFQLLGTNILGLALLKNVLLFSTFLFTYLAARAISGDERTALLAMLSLLLFPQITWESQRDLTHSVLATTLAAATFYAAVRTWKSGKLLDYLLLGVCVGLGTLSKYSYCLVALALAISAGSIPPFRRALLNRWIWVSFAAFLLITAFHFQWILRHPQLTLSRSEEVIRASAGSFLHTRVLGLFSVVKCAFMLGAVLCLVYLFAFRKFAPGPRAQADALIQQWIWRTLLVTGLISAGAAVWLGIELRDRWFQPVVFLGAISAALFVRDGLTPAAEKRFCQLIGLIALAVLLLLPGIPLAASITHRPTRLNAPYATLSAELKRAIPDPTVIVAATRLVGGNLRLFFQQSTVVCPEFNALALPASGRWLVVWDATKSAAPPPALAALVTKLRRARIEIAPDYVEAPVLHAGAKRMKLGYAILP